MTRLEKLVSELEKHVEDQMMAAPDDQFIMIVVETAKYFARLKAEAERRGLWDQIRGRKIS